MKKTILLLIFISIIFISCKYNNYADTTILGNDSILTGKYKTEYIIYYGTYDIKNVIYSDKEIYTCSFQGTNFLLEKDNTEEILSTTAPIRIVKSEIVK